ncbi:MAG: UDP-N-acetylmuramoyl-tripeptide--D-alanyl-D-alanine ligase [Bacteroidota bacterium]|jgi:UDP-N-acetylmuramoyl-tripeptide--D-alanyl-D-alanine ligase
MHIADLYDIFLQHPHVQTDTRKIAEGEIYFALKGDNFDGNKFAEDALAKGAAYAVVDDKSLVSNEKCIVVDDVLNTLQQLAKYHRQQFEVPVLAITGSNGKTTTKELINAVMQTKFKTYCTAGNLNNHIGVPLTLLRVGHDAEFIIIEMGANHQKEIESYCKWALPTHALINNCGKAHLEGFGGIEGVRKGKGELYDFAKTNDSTVFVNTDLDYLRDMIAQRGITKTISYGSTNAQYNGTSTNNNGMLQVAFLNAGQESIIHTQLVGDYNFANVMAAIAVGSTFGIDFNAIQDAIQSYAPSNSRSQLIKQGSNTIILDAYNANPTSMRLAIENFANMDFANKVLMIGGMKELGEDSIAEHQAIVDLVAHRNWNAVALVGGDFANTKHNYSYFDSSTEAGQWLQSLGLVNAAILVKGSRATAMEKVLQA